jgi:hypothetical protein
MASITPGAAQIALGILAGFRRLAVGLLEVGSRSGFVPDREADQHERRNDRHDP